MIFKIRQLIFYNFALMKKVYLDNASTTAMRPEVIQEMTKIMAEDFGNPSSTHSFGRNARTILELSRKVSLNTLIVQRRKLFLLLAVQKLITGF